MRSRADVLGLFSNNVVSFSSNVVLSGLSFSINSVPKPRMLSVRSVYVLSSLQLPVPEPSSSKVGIDADRHRFDQSGARSLLLSSSRNATLSDHPLFTPRLRRGHSYHHY